MKIILERHQYAPELNKAHLGPKGARHAVAAIPAVGATSLSEARAKLFRPSSARIVATVETRYDGELSWLNRRFSGVVQTRLEAVEFARMKRARLVPGGTVHVSTRLVGG